MFNIVPNFFEVDESDVDCGLHKKLREVDMKCLSLNNIGSLVMVFLAFFVLKTTIEITIACFKMKIVEKQSLRNNGGSIGIKVKNIIYRTLKWLCRFFSSSFYWTMLISTEVDLFLGGWIAAFSIGVKKPVNYFANMVVLGLVINIVWFIVRLMRTHF